MLDREAVHAEGALAPLSGLVKWFDPERGFGFVLVNRPERDAFLHVSVLRDSGFDVMPTQGDRITCLVEKSPRGLTVRKVLAVNPISADEVRSVQLVGRVKFYSWKLGYGFIQDEDGQQVFIGSKLLKRLNLAPLRANQLVKVTAVLGERGLVAETLTFLPDLDSPVSADS